MPERNLTFDTPSSTVFAVDENARTITGMVIPYGVIGNNSWGRYQFAKGTVVLPEDVSRVKLLVGHSFSHAIGYAQKLDDTDAGLVGTFKVARGADGDLALSMAQDKVLDGLSAGIGFDAEFTTDKNGVMHAVKAPVIETSVTPLPAFADARVTSVTASAVPLNTNPEKETLMPEENPTPAADTTPAAATSTEPAAPALSAAPGPVATAPVAPESHFPASAMAFSAADIATAVREGFSAAVTELGNVERPVVPAGRVSLSVNEEAQYRFDGTRGPHEFSADVIAYLRDGDGEAAQRVLGFMGRQLGPQFVATSDVAAANPVENRPDMFVPQRRYATPLRDAFYKGSLDDNTPFNFPKFNSASGMAGDHTEGTEPTPGSYSLTNGAVTPSAVSGKIHIDREVWDAGGNPQVSSLIWDQMQYEYMKALELKVAALLNAASPAELLASALAAGADTVANLASPIESAIAGLNFIAGGNRFNYFATHLDLYLALAGLKDTSDRPYYPVINPMNASGSATGGYKSLTVAGTQADPVWSLGTTSDGTAHKSYLADKSAVYFWHSAPTQLSRLREEVEGFDIGIWGYQAGVIADLTGLRKVTYDPTA